MRIFPGLAYRLANHNVFDWALDACLALEEIWKEASSSGPTLRSLGMGSFRLRGACPAHGTMERIEHAPFRTIRCSAFEPDGTKCGQQILIWLIEEQS